MSENINTPGDENRKAIAPPPRNRRPFWLALLLLILAAAGSSVYFYSKRSSRGAEAANDGAGPAKGGNGMPGMAMRDHAATQPSETGSPVGQIYIAPERQQL